jgi:hypothetical protein
MRVPFREYGTLAHRAAPALLMLAPIVFNFAVGYSVARNERTKDVAYYRPDLDSASSIIAVRADAFGSSFCGFYSQERGP